MAIALSDNYLVILRHTYAMDANIAKLPTPSTYARILLQRWPEHAAALLRDADLTGQILARTPTITVAQQLQIFTNAMHIDTRTNWALDLGEHLDISSHGPIGFAALSAPTLGEGLEVLAHFARIRAPYMKYQRREIDQRIVLQVDAACPLGELEKPLIEIVLHIFQSFIEVVLGHRVSESIVMLQGPPPAHAALYANYFHAPCTFNSPINAFTLPADLCALPSLLYDERSYRIALIRCREALDALLRPDDMSTRVRHLLASHFDQIAAGALTLTLPRQEDLAKTLCVSKRTLIRQLATQGSSFRELVSDQQRDAACKLLSQARYSVSEIGTLLGYGDAANFGRAFSRMTGMSPGQYRRKQD